MLGVKKKAETTTPAHLVVATPGLIITNIPVPDSDGELPEDIAPSMTSPEVPDGLFLMGRRRC